MLLTGLCLLLITLVSTACNSSIPEEKTPYRQNNETFFNEFGNKPDYQKLLFANETYPIYYKVLQQAPQANSATKPLQNSSVSVRYSVKLMNGQVVEQDNGAAKEFNIYDPKGSAIIKGLQIALMHMSVGDKWEVIIPWQLGYGRYSQGYTIPAYSALIFEIELLGITKL